LLVNKQPGIFTARTVWIYKPPPLLPSFTLIRVPQHYCIHSFKIVVFVFSIITN
jgi:hypothetical protein